MYKVHFVETNSFDMAFWLNNFDIVVAKRNTGRVFIFIINDQISIDDINEFLNVEGCRFGSTSQNVLEGYLNMFFDDFKELINKWNMSSHK